MKKGEMALYQNLEERGMKCVKATEAVIQENDLKPMRPSHLHCTCVPGHSSCHAGAQHLCGEWRSEHYPIP